AGALALVPLACPFPAQPLTLRPLPEAPAVGGEAVGVGLDAFIDARIAGLVLPFALELAVEPVCEVAQGLDHDLLRISGNRLPGRTIALDADGHAPRVRIAAAMLDVGAELEEV